VINAMARNAPAIPMNIDVMIPLFADNIKLKRANTILNRPTPKYILNKVNAS
jgi:hypothetical protein